MRESISLPLKHFNEWMAQQIFYAAAFPAADTEIYGRKGGELTTNQGTAAPVWFHLMFQFDRSDPSATLLG